MTVQYSGFINALFRWRGSLWKGVLKQLLIWLACYYAIRLVIIYAVPDNRRDDVRALTKMFDSFINRIPLQFLLGFYVVQTVTRWWAQVQAMPWPDDLIANINAMLYENDDDTKSKRKTIGRYVILAFILAWRRVSSAVYNKYENFDILVEAGLMLPEERDILDKVRHLDCTYDYPLHWIYEVVRRKLGNQISFVKELNNLRANFRTLHNYNSICVPLVYTQTATVAVYGYFIFCLIGQQYVGVQKEKGEIDLVFPFLAVLSFIFSVGWLNVAEDLSKPFGNDDDDVEILRILERHTCFVLAAVNAPDCLPLDSLAKEASVINPYVLFHSSGTKDMEPKKISTKLVRYSSKISFSVRHPSNPPCETNLQCHRSCKKCQVYVRILVYACIILQGWQRISKMTCEFLQDSCKPFLHCFFNFF